MQRVQGAQTPYEVYCYHCRVTFPREARLCVHCGGRLGPPGRAAGLDMTAPSQATAQTASHAPAPADEEVLEEEIEGGGLLMRRFGGLAVWAVLALAAVLSNMCEQGG